MRSIFAKQESRNVSEDPNSIHAIIASMVARSTNGIVTIAPGIAARILEETNFEGQRKVKGLRKLKHTKRLMGGSWNPNFPINFAMLPDGTLVLVDGQHRMEAIVEYGIATRVKVNITKVEDYAEVRQLYAGFDEADSSRTEIEVIDGVGLTEDTGVPRTVVKAGMRAIGIIMNNMEPINGGHGQEESRLLDVRLAEFLDWKEEAAAWAEIIATGNRFVKAKMLNAGCMAVGMYTLKHQPGRAREFWGAVADPDKLAKHDPRLRLHSDFQTRFQSSGHIRQKVQAPAIAWNAWNEGRQLKQLKCYEGAAITIWGTPLHKGGR